MPLESIPLRKTVPRHSLRPADAPDDDDSASRTFSSPILVDDGFSSRQLSRDTSPFSEIPRSRPAARDKDTPLREPDGADESSELEFDDWDDQNTAGMPSDLRPELEDHADRRAASPLLGHKGDEEGETPTVSRRSTFHERDPETQAKYETRRRYTYAAIFLALSLVSFTVQTETAVYIQHELKWEKPYCML